MPENHAQGNTGGFFLRTVPSQESPLASGVASAHEADLAEAMPEVPEGWLFAGLVCSDFIVTSHVGRQQ